MLARERILTLFSELDGELCRAGVRGDVFIVGGAAMTGPSHTTLGPPPGTSTGWHPSTEVREAAARVAARHDDVEPDWLNDAVKGFLPRRSSRAAAGDGGTRTVAATILGEE